MKNQMEIGSCFVLKQDPISVSFFIVSSHSFFTFLIHEILIATCTFQSFLDVYSLCTFEVRMIWKKNETKKQNLRTVNIKINHAVKAYNSQENTEQEVR